MQQEEEGGLTDRELEFERRVVALEERLTHDQRLIEQLNEVVVQLQDDVQFLRRSLDRHQQKILQLVERQDSLDHQDPRDEKPPHY